MLRFGKVIALVCAVAGVSVSPSQAATQLFSNEVQVPTPEDLVPPSEAGQFLVEPIGKDELRLTVRGRTFTTRAAAERYLAYRAAEATLEQNRTWFTLLEAQKPASNRGEQVAPRSFRLENWRPQWRYKLKDESEWKTWAASSGGPFFADGKDPTTITDLELTATIKLQGGKPDNRNPLAFEAAPLLELLAPQVSPPQ